MNQSAPSPDQYIPSQRPAATNPVLEVPPWSPLGGRSLRWIVILALVALVFGPLLFRAGPKEVARWYVAGAYEQHLNDKQEEAKQSIETALSWDPDCVEAYYFQALILRQLDDLPPALAAIERALELAPENEKLQQEHNQILMGLQRYAEVIEDRKKILAKSERASVRTRSILLNDIAYARSLGNIDAEQGLKEINEALKNDPSNAAFLDTRAFLFYQLGRYPEAITDLNSSVEQTEAEFEAVQARLAKNPELAGNAREGKRILAEMKRSLAVIRYHRALVWEKLDEQEKATADLDRVRELGEVPGPKLF